jgi:hypothetical protein
VDQARSLFDGEVPLLEAFSAQVPSLLPADIRTPAVSRGANGHVTKAS